MPSKIIYNRRGTHLRRAFEKRGKLMNDGEPKEACWAASAVPRRTGIENESSGLINQLVFPFLHNDFY